MKKLVIVVVLSFVCALGIRFLLVSPIGKLAVLKFTLRSDYKRIAESNAAYRAILDSISNDINRRIASGREMSCSTQILREANWKVNFSDDRKTIEDLIQKLKTSLDEKDQSDAKAQSPVDGSFGGCYSEWFMRMWASAEVVGNLPSASRVKYPLRFLDRINSAEALKTYLWETARNNFNKTHEFNRVRLDDSISGLGRLILSRTKLYDWKTEVRTAYLDFLKEWQNSRTGMWGSWYLVNGLTIKSDDTGTTFHILGQLKCKAANLDRLAETMLKLKKIDFPFGWRVKGKYENHMNWDAVRNFRCAWPALNEDLRSSIRREIRAMVDWSLTESLDSSGVFKTSELDRSTPEAMLYGVNFLVETGFFKSEKRFWTNENFPQSRSTYDKILGSISKMNSLDPTILEARKTLEDNKAD